MIATLTVFSGPMFAGKTSALISSIKIAIEGASRPVVIIKPAMDSRFADAAIVTHDGVSHLALPVASAHDVFAAVATAAAEGDAEKDTGIHLFVDEVQFLDKPYFAGDFHLVVHSLLQAGHTVTCGGLDLDWRGLPFEVTARLLAMADHVTKLTARCNVTGQPAQKTYKRVVDDSRVALGAAETYEARSNGAWEGVDRKSVAAAHPALVARSS